MTDREKAIVMAYTGYTMLAGDKLGIYYQYVQEKLGRSVMTHEFAYKEVQDAIKEAVKEDFIAIAKDTNVPGKLTDEAAIEHLQASGWMQRHDRAMSFDSLTAVINSLMQDENKTISVNVYPWKEDGDD